MNKIKNIIVLIIIIIIILVLIILGIKLLDAKKENDLDEQGDVGEEVSFETDIIKEVTDQTKFYTVSNCVQQYLDSLDTNNDSFYGTDENGNYTIVVDEEEIKQNIYDLLSEEYITENNITIQNVYQYVDKLENKLIFVPLKMKVLENSVIEKYIVYGLGETIDYSLTKYIYMVVNIDNENGTYSIEPLIQEYKNIDEIVIENKNIAIEENDNNIFNMEKVNYEYIVQKYVDNYKKLALGAQKEAYHLLDEEYRTKRFGSLENYQKYIQDNREEIEQIQCTKYLVNDDNLEAIQYIALDQNQKYYIFDEKVPMDFSLKLDNYTIITDTFQEEYDKANNQNKVMRNIDKWVQMLNCRDYNAAYHVLDETFRNNNFGSQEKFEEYMREKYPSHYKLAFSNFSEEGNTYIQKIQLTDMTEQEEVKNVNIIMQLKEGTNFVMSFGIE